MQPTEFERMGKSRQLVIVGALTASSESQSNTGSDNTLETNARRETTRGGFGPGLFLSQQHENGSPLSWQTGGATAAGRLSSQFHATHEASAQHAAWHAEKFTVCS